ncbi:hypothetical protein [Rhodoferax fermentans]|uniref:TnsA endonuclease N-terminal domain-containing protein n=1 Tax=Rhodoferax fermentans TaxID=28066 RepID=A0A1T1ASJ9_RHOFE|nr:hypothetical protein [Rhodoferax fermentans]MBK1684208.1 hypothetical protein [Rhodoferax fermentans]OOV07076.1 hypothetical protein RF819_10365 [Rhodoferax fermentans]
MRVAPTFGVRSSRTAVNTGIRPTARTYGKARIGTYAAKAGGQITVDSDAERLMGHILGIDPRVRSFKQQPFTVDLVGERLLFTREEVSEARRSRGGRRGTAEYTPDFATIQADGTQCAYEVKLEGYEGDCAYWAKVKQAKVIMEAYCYSLSTVVVPTDERHPVLVNAQLLKPAQMRARTYLNSDISGRVEQYCSSGPVLQRDLCTDLQIPTGVIPILLVSGVLQADLAHQHICATLELSAAFGDVSHLCLIEQLVSNELCSERFLP